MVNVEDRTPSTARLTVMWAVNRGYPPRKLARSLSANRGNGDLLGLNFANQQWHLCPRRRAGLDGVRPKQWFGKFCGKGEVKIVRINLQHNLDYLV